MNLAELIIEIKANGIDAVKSALKDLSNESKKTEQQVGTLKKSFDGIGDVKKPVGEATDSVKGFGSASAAAFAAFNEHGKKAEVQGTAIQSVFSKYAFIAPELAKIGEGLQVIGDKAFGTFKAVSSAVSAFSTASSSTNTLAGSTGLVSVAMANNAIKTAGTTTATQALTVASGVSSKQALATGNALNVQSEAYKRLAREAYAAARAQGATPAQARTARNGITKAASMEAGVADMERAGKALLDIGKAGEVAEAGAIVAGTAIGGVAAGLAGLIAVKGAMLAIGLAVSETADKLNDLSKETNVSTERLSLYDLSARMAGSSIEALTGSADKLGMKLAKQDEESGRAVKALDELKVSTKDVNGENKSMLQLQEDIVMAVEKAGNSSRAQGAAVMLLGTEYYKLKTAVKETLEGKKELYDYMSKVGSLTTTKLAKDSDELQDKIAKMKDAFVGMGKSIASSVMPQLNSIVDVISRIAVKAAELIKKYSGQQSNTEIANDELEKAKKMYAYAQKGMQAAFKGDPTSIAFEQAVKGVDQRFKELVAANKKVSDAMAIDEEEKKKVTEGAKGEGNNPAGKPADHSAEIAKQKTLMEQMVGLQHTQNLEYISLNGFDAERIKLEEQASALVAQITGQTKEQKAALVAGILAQYDTNKAMKDQNTLALEAAQLEKDLRLEREKNLKVVDDIFRKSSETISKQRDEFANRNQTKQERDAASKQDAILSPYDSQKQVINDRINRLDKKDPKYDTKKKSAEEELALLEERRSSAKTSINDLIAQQKIAEQSVDEGITRGLTRAADTIPTLADGISSMLESTTKGLQSGLFDLFTKGTFDIKSFFRNLLGELVNLVTQMMIIKPLLEMFKASFSSSGGTGGMISTVLTKIFSAKGNVFSGGDVVPFKNGGVINQATAFPLNNKMGIMGEAGPEAVMPLVRGPNGALGVQSNGGGGGVNQAFNVVVNVTAGKDAQDTGSIVSAEVLRVMKGIANQQIVSARRVGGALNPI
jgi:lambda family phage tail tape measure protein